MQNYKDNNVFLIMSFKQIRIHYTEMFPTEFDTF